VYPHAERPSEASVSSANETGFKPEFKTDLRFDAKRLVIELKFMYSPSYPMAFNSIKAILDHIRARNPALQKRLEEAAAVDAWERTVGSQIAKHARALKVENGVLWVEVDHSVWRTELHHRKRQILERLNQAVLPEPEEGQRFGRGAAKEPAKTPTKTPPPTITDLFLIEPKRTYSSDGKPSRSLTQLKNTKKNHSK
jgi:hypothetical protein